MGSKRLAFNTTEGAVINEDNGQQIDGYGYATVDTDGEWVKQAVKDERLVLQPEDLTTTSAENVSTEAYVAMQALEAEQEADAQAEQKAETKKATRQKASRKDSTSVGDTGSDTTDGADDKTGTEEE